MDHSNAFNRVQYGLLMAKLHAYDLFGCTRNMVISYLKAPHQRVRESKMLMNLIIVPR